MSSILAMLMGIFTIVELNCENLFDCRHDSLKEDTEYLPNSYRHWTHYKYWEKLNHISQTIIACGENNDMFDLPDLVALTEVENDSVLFDLTKRSILRQARYEYIMTNSPDPRGIDVALLYCPFTFKVIKHYPIRVKPPKRQKPTRDILYVKGLTIANDTLHVFVVHAPSRSGGIKETQPYRIHVVTRLIQSVDSILADIPSAKILIAGDFNDTEGDKSIKKITHYGLYDLTTHFKTYNNAKGTYRFKGIWQNLDHIFGTRPIWENKIEAILGDFKFLLKNDTKYGGIKPYRSYNGMRYQNGYSDHLPLIFRFSISSN